MVRWMPVSIRKTQDKFTGMVRKNLPFIPFDNTFRVNLFYKEGKPAPRYPSLRSG